MDRGYVRAEAGADLRPIAINNADEELEVVWGEAHAPGIPDSQHDFMTAEAIRDMAWDLMRKSALRDEFRFQGVPHQAGYSRTTRGNTRRFRRNTRVVGLLRSMRLNTGVPRPGLRAGGAGQAARP